MAIGLALTMRRLRFVPTGVQVIKVSWSLGVCLRTSISSGRTVSISEIS